jgi:hypothetical protein
MKMSVQEPPSAQLAEGKGWQTMGLFKTLGRNILIRTVNTVTNAVFATQVHRTRTLTEQL